MNASARLCVAVKHITGGSGKTWFAAVAVSLLTGCASTLGRTTRPLLYDGLLEKPNLQRPLSIAERTARAPFVKKAAFSRTPQDGPTTLRRPDPTSGVLEKNPEPGATRERWAATRGRILAPFSRNPKGEPSTLRLADLIAEALKKNPGIRAARERWAVASKRILPASSLDDPVFSYTGFAKRVETRTGPQRNRFSISQKFPFFGKLTLKGEVASRQADEAEQLYEARKVEVIARVKSSYYRLFLVHKAIRITRENVEILRRFARVANVKYSTGKASQQDVLKAEVRLSRLANRLITLRQQKQTAEAALNVLLNRPPQALLGRPAEGERRGFKARLEELQRLALKRQPLLLARKEGIRKSRTALALANRQYYPDYALGLSYIDVGGGTTPSPDDGKDALLVTIRFNLPLWLNRRKSNVDAARASIRASQARYEATKNKILFDIQDALVSTETAERLIDLFTNTLLPQAEQSLKASTIGYEADKVDFLNLLDSQRVLQDLQLDYYRALVDFEQRLADLEKAVGVELGRR